MSIQLVVFALGEQEYGVDITKVNGILRAKKFIINAVPGTLKEIEGMINLRGNINYIFNLRTKFGLKRMISDESKFIMLNSHESTIGFIVDEVTDIVKLEDGQIQDAPAFVSISAKYIKGIGKMGDRLITILNPEQILSFEEYSVIQNLAN